jgi:hypothetical protein
LSNAGLEAYQSQELPGISLMQDVAGQLGRDRRRRSDRDEQLGGIDGKGAIEILRSNSDDRGELSVQAKRLSDSTGRSA